MAGEPRELRAEEVLRACDGEALGFETTEELPREQGLIGQPRGREAIEFAVGMPSPGFNVFVVGTPGTGRMEAVENALRAPSASASVPDDWCYVRNFRDPYKPRALRLRAGLGHRLAADVEEFVAETQRRVARAFEGQNYRRQRAAIMQDLQKARAAELERMEKQAAERGFAVQQSSSGFGLVPVRDGKPITPDEYKELDEKARNEIEERGREFQKDISDCMQRIRQLEKEGNRHLEQLNKQVASFAIEHLVDELADKYKEFEEVRAYLEDARTDIIEHLEEFQAGADKEQRPALPGLAAQRPDPTERYAVNVFVDNSDTKGAPVIVESNPTYHNLIGRIEHKAVLGALVTDFTMIKPGALHRANGGYLILEVLPLLRSPFAWDGLKRALKDGRVKTEELNEQFRLISTTSLEPEPIPLDVKVILIGNPMTYYFLYALDEDLRRLFKVRADFDHQMERNAESERQYAAFIGALCEREGLPHFDKGGVGRIIEHASRAAGDQRKLSTMFRETADLSREASHWASVRGGNAVTREDVSRAIEKKRFRSDRIEQRLQELLVEGTLRVDVAGEAVGQVNGLAVLSMADHVFGKPSRITARVFVGKGGVVNLEREAKMSGRIHSKGVMTLTAYLGGQYATKHPLGLSASISFEQLYEEVEGDSASSAELYALLSAIAEVPLRQDVAVTGSVDQHGNVQPVGGVNYKVEGFFDLCKAKGLTGEQGVMIPAANVHSLMLREDVCKAIADGAFHVWAAESVQQGLHLLTGLTVGHRDAGGRFPKGSFNRSVELRLEALAKASAAAEEKPKRRRKKRDDAGTADGDGSPSS